MSLCLTCTYVRRVHGRRGQTYLLCRNDEIAEKYPRQPVAGCTGYRDARTTAGTLAGLQQSDEGNAMSTVTATDHEAIVRVAQLYIDGFNDCSEAAFREAFHEDAWMYLTDAEGDLKKVFLADVFEKWSTPPAPRIVGRVLSVTQSGDVAGVLLGYDNQTSPERCWVDLLSLLRIDGSWKIMNKIATHASRGGWGAEQPA
jgi:hypothetical protein